MNEPLRFPLSGKKITNLLDRLSFFHILLLWCSILIAFGFLYVLATGEQTYLLHTATQQPVHSILDSIYFSFITATSTGFGDIVPIGWFKIIAIIEVICGLILLTFVTFKLVALKQDIILREIYEISLHEKIHRVRSSLLLFRQQIHRLMEKAEERLLSKKEMADLHIPLASLQEILFDLTPFLGKTRHHDFTKTIDPVSMELIGNSILQSFERLLELLKVADHLYIKWKQEQTLVAIEKCLLANEQFFQTLPGSGILSGERIKPILERQERNLVEIRERMKTGL